MSDVSNSKHSEFEVLPSTHCFDILQSWCMTRNLQTPKQRASCKILVEKKGVCARALVWVCTCMRAHAHVLCACVCMSTHTFMLFNANSYMMSKPACIHYQGWVDADEYNIVLTSNYSWREQQEEEK